MKTNSLISLPLRAALAGLLSSTVSSLAVAAPSHPRTLHVEAVVNAPVGQVWQAWSTSQGASEFLAPRVVIELQKGGLFQVYFDPNDTAKSSRGAVLSFVPGQSISFEWHLPPLYPELQATAMQVVVTVHADGSARTVVTIEQSGWGEGPRWDDAFTHMHRGWGDLLGRLQQRFATGPIDWTAEMAQGADRKNFTLKDRATTNP